MSKKQEKEQKHKPFEEWLKKRDPALYESATTTSDIAPFLNRVALGGFAAKDSFFGRRRQRS